jgi:hypothetical protein
MSRVALKTACRAILSEFEMFLKSRGFLLGKSQNGLVLGDGITSHPTLIESERYQPTGITS